ncbi:hypothetical protein CTAYLR_008124 [Chrysophaeum taylorii]|uniref:Ankyrin repeat domain containing protein n=1 Tax=Chrysophaeum taylorii TaxID=2483200 RepID=A0AAD7UK38_9STRA|nr:hypothetical protein CTAYLR_008124 [Chrysophaeum taylorii]
MLIEMQALAMLNGVDDDIADDPETKRRVLCELVTNENSNGEWVFDLLDGVSDEALDALIEKRIATQAQVVEVSKLFDKVGVPVEKHTGLLLAAMVPGRYDPKVDDNVRLPSQVGSPASTSDREFLEFFKTGAIDWIEWIVFQNDYLRTCVCHTAARAGQLEVLKWARANDCPWDWRTCANAACRGHLEVLKWARANGCPWDSLTCTEAAAGGHLEVLEWARANGCPRGHHRASPTSSMSRTGLTTPFMFQHRYFANRDARPTRWERRAEQVRTMPRMPRPSAAEAGTTRVRWELPGRRLSCHPGPPVPNPYFGGGGGHRPTSTPTWAGATAAAEASRG